MTTTDSPTIRNSYACYLTAEKKMKFYRCLKNLRKIYFNYFSSVKVQKSIIKLKTI